MIPPASAVLSNGAAPGTVRWRRVGIALLVLSPLAFALASGFPLCPSAALLGLPCPGCGLTRATLHLLHGDLAAAFQLHPLVLPLAPLYFGAMGTVLVDFVRGPRASTAWPWITRRWVSIAALALLLATLGVWGARFFGYFGGPVPVETYVSWALAQRAP